tara:strand:- start:18 stop:662 length:645 start_codon:yes stop_codon:yes gene_type:complete
MYGKSDHEEDIWGDEYYQTMFGMMNRDDRVWECASHPDVVAVASHFLGNKLRAAEAVSKPTWPGAPSGALHTDDGSFFHDLPKVPWLINSMWMLTDFTKENGATGMVPLSHRSRMKKPPPDYFGDDSSVEAITGKIGSVVLWHGGMFHQSRANVSDQIRVGLNIPYYPPWFNIWIEGGHQPVWPETFYKMPPEMQQLCPGRLGRKREDLYEVMR